MLLLGQFDELLRRRGLRGRRYQQTWCQTWCQGHDRKSGTEAIGAADDESLYEAASRVGTQTVADTVASEVSQRGFDDVRRMENKSQKFMVD